MNSIQAPSPNNQRNTLRYQDTGVLDPLYKLQERLLLCLDQNFFYSGTKASLLSINLSITLMLPAAASSAPKHVRAGSFLQSHIHFVMIR